MTFAPRVPSQKIKRGQTCLQSFFAHATLKRISTAGGRTILVDAAPILSKEWTRIAFLFTEAQLQTWKIRMASFAQLDMARKKVGGMHAQALFEAQHIIGIQQHAHIAAAHQKTRHSWMTAEVETVFGLQRFRRARSWFVHALALETPYSLDSLAQKRLVWSIPAFVHFDTEGSIAPVPIPALL